MFGVCYCLVTPPTHPSKPILNNYPNSPKNHKLEGVVLVEEDVKVMRRGSDAIPVFVFTHANFPDKKIYAAKPYIHVTQEGTDDRLIFLANNPIRAAGAGGIGALIVDRNNRNYSAEANDASNLLLGRM